MSLLEDILAGFNVEHPIGTITGSTGSVGNMTEGTYQYKVSYITAFGESFASAVSAPIFSIGQVQLNNIPISSSSEVMTKNLYRTTVGGTIFKRLVTIMGTATTYADSDPDSVLGADEPVGNWAHSSQKLEGWVGFTKPIIYSTAVISAAGLTLADATLLTSEYSYCNVPHDLAGVILPVVKGDLIGQKFTIINQSLIYRLSVYPANLTESIGTMPPGDPLVLQPTSSTEIVTSNSISWSISNVATTVEVVPTISGDVFGPNLSATNAIVRFSSTSGKNIKNSSVLVSDAGDITGVNDLVVTTLTATDITGAILTASQPHITSLGILPSATITALTSTTIAGTLTTAAQTNITSVGTLSSLNVTGLISAATIAGTLTTSAQTNITSLGTLGSLNITGLMSAGTIAGTLTTPSQTNITTLGTLGSLNVTGLISAGSVSVTTLSGTLTTASQTNITAIGTLGSLSVTGLMSAGTIAGTLTTAVQTNITSVGTLSSLNVTGLISAGTIAGTLTTSSQTNITTIGTLGTLSVTGLMSAGTLAGTLTTAAQTNITSVGTLGALAVTGGISAATIAGTLTTAAQTNITSVGTLGSLTVTGNVSAATVTGTLTTAAQTNITSLGTLGSLGVTGLISAGTIAGTLTTAVQTNITSVGTLGSLNVTGLMSAGTIAGTLTTPSQTNITSVGTLGSLTVTNGISAGTIAGTLTTAAQTNVTSVGTLGSLTVTGAISAGSLSATTLAGTLTTAAQTNITSVGTLGSLTVTGLVSAGTIAGTLTTSAQPNITSLGTITTLTAGTVNATNIAGTITTTAQTNITSVGTLGSLAVTGLMSAGTIAGTLTTATQTNITSVGTLNSLIVTGAAILNGSVTLNAGGSVATGYTLTLLDLPAISTDATNKSYVDTSLSNTSSYLPAGLTSIGALTTSGNEIIYTTATNTYATSPITGAGRSFISAGSALDQRAALGLVIGADVQGYSPILANIVSVGGGAANNILYTTGSGISNSSLGPFIRTSFLPSTTAAAARTAIQLGYLPASNTDLSADAVIGAAASQTLTNKTIGTTNFVTLGANTTFTGLTFDPSGATDPGNVLAVVGSTIKIMPLVVYGDVFGPVSSVANTIPRFNGTTGKTLKTTAVTIDDSNNITGVAGLSASTISATSISGTIITAAQPNITSLGSLSGLTINGTVSVNGLLTLNAGANVPTGQKITLVDQPVLANDAVNKLYVDNAATTGAAPLTSAYGATAAVLPNTPAYSSAAATLTAIGSVTALSIDGNSYTAGDGRRILVKDQADPRQNGVYTRTTDSAGNWQLTRVSDFNQPAEAVKNTTIFVVNGTTNVNTGWALQSTVTQFNPSLSTPGGSDVNWVQASGSQNIVAGTGMSQTGNTFNVNGTTNRITSLSTSIDISAAYVGQTSITTLGIIGTGTWQGSVVGPTYGGTGIASPTAGNVLITNGTSPMTLKTNPTGTFVGTTDSQTLTNKIIDAGRINAATSVFATSNVSTSNMTLDLSALTATRSIAVPDSAGTLALIAAGQTLTNKTITSNTNNVIAQELFVNSGAASVSTFASGVPTSGQVLTATSGTTAIWQNPSAGTAPVLPGRTIYVYKGAPNASPNYASVSAAISAASALTPTSASPVLIQIYPGTYSEATPLNLPQFVILASTAVASAIVIIRPTVPAPSNPVMVTVGNGRISGVTFDCHDGSGGYATIGIHATGNLGRLDVYDFVLCRNASVACFQATGGGGSTHNSHVVFIRSCSAQVTVPGLIVPNGILSTAGATISGYNNVITGFFTSGLSGTVTNGMSVTGDCSLIDFGTIGVTYCTNAVNVGGSTATNSQSDYPTFRIVGLIANFISSTCILMNEKSVCRMSNVRMADTEAFYPNQVHLTINSPALPAEPNLLVGDGLDLREDKIVYAGPGNLTNPSTLRLWNLSEVPGDIKIIQIGAFSVGTSVDPSALSVGSGAAHKNGLVVLHDTAGVFSNVTTRATANSSTPLAVGLASTAAINLASAPSTIDGVAPTSGVTRVLVKDGSAVSPGTTSVANGIYVWNGTGAAMTRSADFAATTSRDYNTWFAVDLGTVNSGTLWRIDATTLVNTENVIIGTTAFGLSSQSVSLFPALTNNNAMYFGLNTLQKFSGLKIGITKAITSATNTSTNVLVFEYWNASTWVTAPIMTTDADTTGYTNRGNESFGFGVTIASSTIYTQNVRFSGINLTWASSTINGTLAYWIRVRCTAAVSITRNPMLTNIKIHEDQTRINKDGFTEHFGFGRPIRRDDINVSQMVVTGTAGETAPTTINLSIGATIGFRPASNGYPNAVVTASSFAWNPSSAMDTSAPVTLRLNFQRSSQAANGNIAINIVYAFVKVNDVITDTAGTANSVTRSTGIIAYAASTTFGGAFILNIPLDFTGFLPDTQTAFIKVIRAGTNVLDTIPRPIALLHTSMAYACWCEGISYTG